MMMKKLLCVFMAFSILVGLTSCGQSTKNNDALTLAIENIKQPLTLMDERFAIYENALDSVNAYIASPTAENLKNARTTCAKAIGNIAELQDTPLGFGDADLKKMMDIGLNTEDYRVPFNYSDYYKNENIQTLTFIIYYLNQAPALNNVLKYVVKFNIDYQTINRKVEYLCVNELFCKFSGNEIEGFKNEFLPSLKVFSGDKLPWDTDSGALEAKANKLLSDAESDIDDYSEFLGGQYTELLKAQSNYKDMLLSAGYDETEADKIISDIDKLSSKSELLP
jgi:hypothetical protein